MHLHRAAGSPRAATPAPTIRKQLDLVYAEYRSDEVLKVRRIERPIRHVNSLRVRTNVELPGILL